MIEITIPLPPAALQPHAKGHWRAKAGPTKEYKAIAEAETRNAIQEFAEMFTDRLAFPTDNKVRAHHEWFLGKSEHELSYKAKGKPCPKSKKPYRPRDQANGIQALKAAIDGVVQGGLLTDDAWDYLEWGKGIRHGTAKQHGGRSCVVLRFEILDERARL